MHCYFYILLYSKTSKQVFFLTQYIYYDIFYTLYYLFYNYTFFVERSNFYFLQALEIDDDHECQRYACLALGNIAASVDNHASVLGGGALAPLCEALKAQDLETRFYAAFALGKLGQAAQNHAR